MRWWWTEDPHPTCPMLIFTWMDVSLHLYRETVRTDLLAQLCILLFNKVVLN